MKLCAGLRNGALVVLANILRYINLIDMCNKK